MSRGAWPRCAQCGKATYYCGRHGCRPAAPKPVRHQALIIDAFTAGFNAGRGMLGDETDIIEGFRQQLDQFLSALRAAR